MPAQLQLEGPDLETLLSRVKAEHGPGARIVRAEKVRTGGVAGFFAKQRFEICVELDALPGARALPTAVAPLLDIAGSTPASAPTSLLDLAEQVSAAERSTHARGAAVPAGTDRRATGRRAVAPPVTDHGSDNAGAISTEGTNFAAVLARLGVAAGRWDDETVPAAAAAAVSSGPSADEAPDTPAAAPLPALPRQRAASEPSSAVSLRRTAEVAVRASERPAASVHVSGVSGQLVQLGLPEHLLPAPAAGPLYPSLVQSLRRLPKVPRATNRAGGALVVVGPQDLALEVARGIARDLGLPMGTAVVLATSRRGRAELPAKQVVRTPAAAAERRVTWRRRRNLTVVALDAPLTASGAATARAFLTALQPSTTWGVVEATRKAHDVGNWARALGGVDALALTAVEETADPAAVLTLGIPVGRLGGAKATPAAWAALLTNRMAA